MVKEAGSRAASTLHCQHPSAKCHCEDGETKIKRLHLCSSTIIGSHILGDVLVQPIKSFANFQYWMDLHRNQFDVQILKKNAVRISTPRIKQGFRSEKSLLTCLVANLFHIGYFDVFWGDLRRSMHSTSPLALRSPHKWTFVLHLCPFLGEFPWDGNVGNSTNLSKWISMSSL